MYINQRDAHTLKNLGFSVPDIMPGQVYFYKKREWVVGGLPGKPETALIPQEVIKKGTWLARDDYLWEWLIKHTDKVSLEKATEDDPNYKGSITLQHHIITIRGYTFTQALFKLVEAVLQHYNKIGSISGN